MIWFLKRRGQVYNRKLLPSLINSQSKKYNMPGFWKDAAASIPIAGQIIGGMIERGQSRRAIERQNEYNTPVNQLARLREAGLPFAAFSDTAAGNQSQPQETRDSGLGEIGQYASTRMMQKQMELLDAQIYTEQGQGEKVWKEAWIKQNEGRELEDRVNESLAITSDDRVIPANASNQVRTLKREREIRALDKIGKALSNDLMGIEKELKSLSIHELEARIENIIQNTSLGIQEFRDNDLLKDFDRKLALAIREGTETHGLTARESVWAAIRKWLTK